MDFRASDKVSEKMELRLRLRIGSANVEARPSGRWRRLDGGGLRWRDEDDSANEMPLSLSDEAMVNKMADYTHMLRQFCCTV